VAIDTDGALRFNYVLPDEKVFAAQKKAGVPCLYQAENLVQCRDLCLPLLRELTDGDFDKLRKYW